MIDNFNSDWNDEQENLIEKMKWIDKKFRNLLEIDKEGLVIDDKVRKELENLGNKNRKMLDKMINSDISVAIIGMEKAGKSTLANALMKNELLPARTERCTYATTKIRAGNKDFAVVSFYSYTQFQNIFQSMLEILGYNDTVDFQEFSRAKFDRFWNAMEDRDLEKFHLYNGTIAEEVRAMLDGKEVILSLLGKPSQKIAIENTDELSLYITGIKYHNQEGLKERTSHPFAVGSIFIQSTKMHGLENVAFYDIPGFDMSVQSYNQHIEDILKKVDIIIFVTNAAFPNLTSPQLEALRKCCDREGEVPLRDKAFVFGNKIDMASSKQSVLENEAILRNEVVNKHMIAVDNHVLVGSAKAYLEECNILDDDGREFGATPAYDRLKEWKLSNGVYSLRKRIKDYYTYDRYKILEKRAEANLVKVDSYLRELLDNYNQKNIKKSIDVEDKLAFESMINLNKFLINANTIFRKHAKEIRENRTFSKLIENNIEKIFPLTSAFQKELEYIKMSGNIYDDLRYNLSRIDCLIREKLREIFSHNIVEFIARITLEEQQKMQQELIEEILTIMGLSETSPYKEELIQSVHKLFTDLGVDKCHFNSLVERFTIKLIESVITWPFNSKQRYDFIKTYVSDFRTLSLYYKPNNNEEEIYTDSAREQIVFRKILLHEGENHNSSKDITSTTENMSFGDFWQNLVSGDECNIESESDLLRILDTDIEILRDIIVNAVVPAMEIEQGYNIVINKNIKLICDGIRNDADCIGEWLSQNIEKIAYKQYLDFNNEMQTNQIRESIIKSIKSIVNS